MKSFLEPLDKGNPATGIRIFGFKGGLLHTKSVVVYRHVALFGSVNVDFRSFWLKFEVTLGMHDPDLTHRIKWSNRRLLMTL